MISSKLLLGQVNCMYPRILKLRTCSLENDFAFVSKMFLLTGNDLRKGVEVAEKSNDKSRARGSY